MSRILYLGTKDVGKQCLEILGDYKKFLTGVVTLAGKENEEIQRITRRYRVPLFVDIDVNSPEFLKHISASKTDVVLCISYPMILKKAILNLPPLGCINMHPAYLPEEKGCFPTIWAILKDKKRTGYTIHYMDEGIDTGDIIAQVEVPIFEDDTGYSLYKRQVENGVRLFQSTYENILDKTNPRRKQIPGFGEYHKNRLPDDGIINWSWNARYIVNFIRVLYHPDFPGAITYYMGKKVEILDSEIVGTRHPATSEKDKKGQINSVNPNGLIVKVKDGAVMFKKM